MDQGQNGHIAYSRFGLSLLGDMEERLSQLHSTKVKMDNLTAQYMLRQEYEHLFTIHDHDVDDNPLALVQLNPQEDATNYSPLYKRFYDYRQLDIATRWGLSISDLMDLPREYVELIMRISREEIARDNTQLTEAERKLAETRPGNGHKRRG